MPTLEPDRFTAVTGALLVAATALLALGVERMVRGQALVAWTALALGVAATVTAFSLRVQGDPTARTVLLVTKDDCPLCEEARTIVEHVQTDLGFDLWTVNIDHVPEDGGPEDAQAHDELRRQFALEVPVLLVDGEPVAAGQVSEADVRGALEPDPADAA